MCGQNRSEDRNSLGNPVLSAGPVVLFAAGSLKDALGEVAREFEAATGVTVTAEFGPSGILRERIFNGAAAHVFASADMRNAQILAGSEVFPVRSRPLLPIRFA